MQEVRLVGLKELVLEAHYVPDFCHSFILASIVVIGIFICHQSTRIYANFAESIEI